MDIVEKVTCTFSMKEKNGSCTLLVYTRDRVRILI